MTETNKTETDNAVGTGRLRYEMSRTVVTALADLITVVEWLASTKTPTGEVAVAMRRLHELVNELAILKEKTVTETE
jgi:hypothetical protein